MLGAHIPKKKSLLDTIKEIQNNGGNVLQFFSKSPRSGNIVDIVKYTYEKKKILEALGPELDNFKLVIHGSYLINIATPLILNKRSIDIYDTYWFKSIISELEFAQYINGEGVIIHVGKYTKQTVEEGIKNMKYAIKEVIKYIKETKIKSKIILETGAGQGTELLVDINELIKFYNEIDEKENFKLCFDTCHIWSAGYNLLESYKKIQKETNDGISVIHLNGSITEKNSRKDRHSTINSGTIPKKEMEEFIIYIRENKKMIIILETPSDNLKKELDYIKKLGS
jgi:deoxyribonuclease-4